MARRSNELDAVDPADAAALDTDYNTDMDPTGAVPMGTTATGDTGTDMYTNTTTFGDTGTITDLDEADPEVIAAREQVEQTRTELSSTIDAIQEKLSPGNLVQEAKDTVRDATIGKAQDMVSNVSDAATGAVSNVGDTARGWSSGVVETVKANPIPAALIGVGLGWLFMSGRRSSDSTGYHPRSTDYDRTYYPQGYNRSYGSYRSNDTGYESRYSSPTGYGAEYRERPLYTQYGESEQEGTFQGARDAAGNVAGAVQNTAGQVAGTVQDTASQVAGTVQDTAGQVAGTVQDTASQVANQAQYGVQRAQTGFQRLMTENPLAVGAAAVVLGMAVGLSVPESEKENEVMGPARDQLMDQAQQTVQQTAQKVQAVAQEAVGAAQDAAKNAAQDQGLTQQ